MRRHLSSVVMLSLIAMLAMIVSCSDKTTNPAGGQAAKELNSGDIANSSTYPHTFANAGTYNYHCTIHGAGMAGQVVVSGGAPMAAAVSIVNNSYTPSPASVGPGGTVTWTNNGTTHTVTSD